ncbi:hypothetical protein ACWCQS_21025 [Streptomyces sp. NPDC002076]
MDTTTAPAILAEQLRVWGLSVTNTDDRRLSVVNPVNPACTEAVGTRDGLYVTGWGYELGESGDEAGTAQRLALLLSRPSGWQTSGTETQG